MVAKKLGRSAEIINTTYTGGNLTWVGDTVVGTAGENITVGNVVFLQRTTNTWLKAKADYTGTLEGRLGIATETFASGATGSILTNGIIRYDTLAMTANVEYFVSEATAGAITASVPVATPALIRSIGYAQSAGVLVFNPENTYHYEYLAVQKNFGDVGTNYFVEKDNNGVERKFFKDDFSNDTLANYTVTGAPTIGSGVLTMAYGDKIIKALDAGATTGKWEVTFKFDTDYDVISVIQRLYLYFGSSSSIFAERTTGDAINLKLAVNGSTLISTTSTGATLADGTYGRLHITYDGTNYQMYWNGVAVGSAAGAAPTTPSIGVLDSGASANAITVNEITYTTSVAFTDSFTADTESRYRQVTDGTASAAGDVVVTTGTPGYITLSSNTASSVTCIGKSYKYKSGSFKVAFIDNGNNSGVIDRNWLLFGYKDTNNYYTVLIEELIGTYKSLNIFKRVNGSLVSIGSSVDLTAIYTKGNKTWIEVQHDVERGIIYVYIWDNASTKPTTPTHIGFDAQFNSGEFGFQSSVSTIGAGNLSTRWSDFEVRANSIIDETNVPITETGYYLSNGFDIIDSGRWTGDIASYTWTGTTLTSTSTTDRFIGLMSTKLSNFDVSLNTTFSTFGFIQRAIISMFDKYPSVSSIPAVNGYYLSLQRAGTGAVSSLILYRVDNGTPTQLLNITGQTIADATPYTLRLTRTDGLFTVYLDGVSKGSVIDTAYIAQYPGVCVYNNSTELITFNNLTISGTRYYMKPMLRGAQIGEYWDGVKSVPCTRFTDDFNWDTSGEYTVISTPTFDTTNGVLSITGSSKAIATKTKYGIGSYNIVFSTSDTSGGNYHFRMDFLSADNTLSSDHTTATKYILYAAGNSINLYQVTTTGVGMVAGAAILSANVIYDCMVTVTATTISLTVNGVSAWSVAVDPTIPLDGYAIAGVWTPNAGTVKIYSWNINALESTSTNGIAVSIGGIAHGALFGVASGAYIYGTPSQLGFSGKYIGGANCKTMYGSATKYIRHNLLNITDAKTLALDTNDYTTGTAVIPTTTYSLAKRQPFGIPAITDSTDTLYLKAILDTTAIAIDTQPATFINGFSFRSEGENSLNPVSDYEEVTISAKTCSTNMVYIANNTSLVTFTLPTIAPVGSKITIMGKGAGMWKVAQNASQYIRIASGTSTVGTAGYIAASNQYDVIELVCTTANNGWMAKSVIGSMTVV